MARFHAQALELSDQIHRLPGDEAHWQRILAALGATLGLHSILMLRLEPTGRGGRLIRAWGLATEWLERYRQRFAAAEPLLPPDAVRYSGDPAALAALERTGYRREFMRPLGIGHICQGAIACSGQAVRLWRFQWPRRAGPPGRWQRRLVGCLATHLAGRVELEARLAALDAERHSAEQALEALGAACLIVDARARPRYFNRTARQLLAAADGLRLTPGGQLTADRPRPAAALRRGLQRALQPDRPDSRRPELLAIERPSGRADYTVFIWPYRRHAVYANARALILINDPEQQSQTLAHHLIQLYDLTPAEARVALLLLQGRSPAAIAERHRVSPNTVRSQIKSLLLKTDTRRQGELVAQIYRTLGRLVR